MNPVPWLQMTNMISYQGLVRTFPKDLERRMVRLGERAKEAIIIVEGIYSMLGDVAPLAEIVDIKRSSRWLFDCR